MQFRVVPAVGADPTTPPQFLRAAGDRAAAGGDAYAPLALSRRWSMVIDDEGQEVEGPVAAVLGT